MKEKLLQFLNDDDGLTTVEYAVAGALVAATLVGAFVSLGDQIAIAIALMTDAIS